VALLQAVGLCLGKDDHHHTRSLLAQLQPVRGCCERWALRAELNKMQFGQQQSQPTALD